MLKEENMLSFNPLYTGGLFHCYMLDESIYHLSCLFCRFYSICDGKSC